MCFPFNSETDMIYLAIHDGGDLSGLDSRYHLGNHACTHFCVYCQIDDKNKVSKEGTAYRTPQNINLNADLYGQASRRNSNHNGATALQISRGVAGRPPDPYPGSSRITPPLLHIDMGISTKLLAIHNEYVSDNLNCQQAHKQKLDQYGIYTNRYYHSLEGRQAKLYRRNFSKIASVISSTTFYIYMNHTIQLFNQLMSIIGKSDCWIEETQCEEARQLLQQLDMSWTHTRTLLGIAKSLGAKYHYLSHCFEYMTLWRIGIGYCSEQSIESYHKTCSMVFRRYGNQRGLLRIKYAIRQLMLITSPTYQN